MNERILALVKQATVSEPYYPAGNDGHPEYRTYVSQEKFAELIIKDCASICEINGQSYKHSFTPARARLAESTSNHCAMMINKHFGVEE